MSVLKRYIKNIILESLEVTEDDKYDLEEWISNDLELEFQDSLILLKKFNIEIIKRQTNTNIIFYLFSYNNQNYVLFEDDTNPTLSCDFIERVSFYNDYEKYILNEDFNEGFWKSPSILYHGTSSDNLESIKENGLESRNQSRGISNKGTSNAVFTSLEKNMPEQYGDVLISINTHLMKQDRYMPYVSLEEPIIEYESIESLKNLVGCQEYSNDLEHGIDYDTIIVFGDIPYKYLTIVNF